MVESLGGSVVKRQGHLIATSGRHRQSQLSGPAQAIHLQKDLIPSQLWTEPRKGVESTTLLNPDRFKNQGSDVASLSQWPYVFAMRFLSGGDKLIYADRAIGMR
jgi:hypothetical protein